MTRRKLLFTFLCASGVLLLVFFIVLWAWTWGNSIARYSAVMDCRIDEDIDEFSELLQSESDTQIQNIRMNYTMSKPHYIGGKSKVSFSMAILDKNRKILAKTEELLLVTDSKDYRIQDSNTIMVSLEALEPDALRAVLLPLVGELEYGSLKYYTANYYKYSSSVEPEVDMDQVLIYGTKEGNMVYPTKISWTDKNGTETALYDSGQEGQLQVDCTNGIVLARSIDIKELERAKEAGRRLQELNAGIANEKLDQREYYMEKEFSVNGESYWMVGYFRAYASGGRDFIAMTMVGTAVGLLLLSLFLADIIAKKKGWPK